MEPSAAQADLALVRRVAQTTRRRIDAHAFHCVHWGWIVLVWYPLGHWRWRHGYVNYYLISGIGAFVIGVTLSAIRGRRIAQHPRIRANNLAVPRTISMIVLANILAGSVLSAVLPMTAVVHGEDVPILWGLIYANIAFAIGVVYHHEFVLSGIAIFIGCILALLFKASSGYILGPFMGLGMLLPGYRAEMRTRLLIADQSTLPLEETGSREKRAQEE